MHLKSKAASLLRLYFSGMMMGSADIVPGVSGGTIAFLLGIYEQLIYSIKVVSGDVLRLALSGKLKEAWKKIPFGFLVPLAMGILSAIILLVNIVSYLLRTFPSFVWAFFFGLVLASVMVVRKRVVTWNKHDYAALVVSTIAAYFIVGAVPVETPSTLLAFFISGAIAICAMILPGISGSFLLVIMGKYEQILLAASEKNIVVLGIFMAGAVVGLALFSRVLSWLFAKHHDIVVAALTGFMLGSLRKVWPWKEAITTRINSHGDIVPLVEKNLLPDVSFNTLLAIVLMITGYLLITSLDKFQMTKERTEDVGDRTFSRKHAQAVQSQNSGQI